MHELNETETEEKKKAKAMYNQVYNILNTYSMSKVHKKMFAKALAINTANECLDMWTALHANFLASRSNQDAKQCQLVHETATYKYWNNVIKHINNLS